MKKTILIVASTLSFLFGFTQAPQNPYIIKDTTGKILSQKEIEEYTKNGASLQRTGLKEEGKPVVIIRTTSKEQIEKEAKERLEKLNALVNKPLSGFALKNLNDESRTGTSYDGKVRVLNFWFVECNPCVREMPELNKLVATYKNKPVSFIAPSVSYKDKIQGFLKKNVFNYEILPDAGKYIDLLAISSFPTHIIVDKKGIVRKVYEGYDEHIVEKLSKDIDALLKE